jgi:type IV secretory pathway VirB10-like protein
MTFKRLPITLSALLSVLFIAPSQALDYRINPAIPPPESSSWKGVKQPIPLRGNYFMPTGFTFNAILGGAVFSYNLTTPAIAVTDDDVVYQGEVVIPRGSRFIGSVGVTHTLDRINIDFMTCVFPDGQEIRLSAIALSMDGSAGIPGKVEKHTDVVAAKVAMKAILNGVQTATSAAAPTVENSMVNDLTQQASQNIDVPNVKTLESVYVEDRTPLKIFVRQRTEY